MRIISKLIIDVSYHPCDPGINHWFSEETKYSVEDIKTGQKLSYNDPSGLFGGIQVKEITSSSVTVEYAGTSYTLTDSDRMKKLGEGGRDYTEFLLYVLIEFSLVIEDTPEFFSEWLSSSSFAGITEDEAIQLKSSQHPCAKYLYGRYVYLMATEEEKSASIAQDLLEEASEAGIGDATAVLSIMYSRGETKDDRMDLDKAEELCKKSIEQGSELGRLLYAKHRVSGFLNSREEPEVVAREIEKMISENPSVAVQWYSVLGYAYETIGNEKKAAQVFQEGITKGNIDCYLDLAVLSFFQDRKDECRKWKEQGIAAGCGDCYDLDVSFPQDQFEELSPEEQKTLTATLKKRLKKGLKLGSSTCAFWLGFNYFYGALGFETDADKGSNYLLRSKDMGNCVACSTLADIMELGDPSREDLLDAARFRLMALRYGDDSELEKVIKAYREGFLDAYQDEIEEYWLEQEDEIDEDDGRDGMLTYKTM